MAFGGKETLPLGERQEENCECQKAYVGKSATYMQKDFH